MTTTTPDPITTAREALRRLANTEVDYPGYSFESDYETVQAALIQAEKLKAERDAWKGTADARMALIIRRTADRDRLTSQLEQAQGSVARLEADRNDWHDSYQKLAVRFEEQGSQLEQAERVIAPFAEIGTEKYPGERHTSPVYALERQTGTGELRLYSPFSESNTEVPMWTADFLAASQWIKDRQAKGEAS